MGRLGKWQDYTAEERLELSYDDILSLRQAAYRRHVAAMRKAGGIPAEMDHLAAVLEKRYGPIVRIWKNEVGYLEAFLIGKYGEEPAHWPTTFTGDDLARMKGWVTGRPQRGPSGRQKANAPKGVVYLDHDLEAGLVQTFAPFVGLVGAAFGGVGGVLIALGLFGLLSALTNFWENELIDHLFRARSYTAPTDHFIALYTAAPGETGGGTEVSGGSYARVQTAAGFSNWEGTGGETTNVDSAGTGGGTQNRNAITFPTPSANWGTVTHFASLDASSGGNFYFYGALTASKNVNNGDPAPSFQAGALDFALA